MDVEDTLSTAPTVSFGEENTQKYTVLHIQIQDELNIFIINNLVFSVIRSDSAVPLSLTDCFSIFQLIS